MQFSPSLVQHLSDLPSSPGESGPSSSRQSTLDEHIRERIASELSRLKAQEAELQEKIHRALEQENLSKESSQEKNIKSSTVLQQELDEITRKVEEHREKRNIEKNYPEVFQARNQLLQCYRQYKDRPLDCWQEAADFRSAVKRAEQVSRCAMTNFDMAFTYSRHAHRNS
jgi:altered-inheritance-of-mitochondria protein 13